MPAEQDVTVLLVLVCFKRRFFHARCTADHFHLAGYTFDLLHTDSGINADRSAADIDGPDDIGKGNRIAAACGGLDLAYARTDCGDSARVRHVKIAPA